MVGTFLNKMILNLYADVSLPVHLHRVKCLLKLLLDFGLFCKCLLERFFFLMACLHIMNELIKLQYISFGGSYLTEQPVQCI